MRVATPWKHPETGIYHFRKGVPEALRALLGKREEKLSLGTRDPKLARVLHAAKAAEVEARWAGLRADAAPQPVVKLTDTQEWALAGEIYRRHFAAHEDNPEPVESWDERLLIHRWRRNEPEHELPADWCRPLDRFLLRQLQGPAVDAVLAEHGIAVDWDGRQRLLRRVVEEVEQADNRLKRAAEGDYSPDARREIPRVDAAGDERDVRPPLDKVRRGEEAGAVHPQALLRRHPRAARQRGDGGRVKDQRGEGPRLEGQARRANSWSNGPPPTASIRIRLPTRTVEEPRIAVASIREQAARCRSRLSRCSRWSTPSPSIPALHGISAVARRHTSLLSGCAPHTTSRGSGVSTVNAPVGFPPPAKPCHPAQQRSFRVLSPS